MARQFTRFPPTLCRRCAPAVCSLHICRWRAGIAIHRSRRFPKCSSRPTSSLSSCRKRACLSRGRGGRPAPLFCLTMTVHYRLHSTRLFDWSRPTRSDVLINEDWVAVGIHHHKACGTRRTLVGLGH